MSEEPHFDVIVIGMEPGGKVAASNLPGPRPVGRRARAAPGSARSAWTSQRAPYASRRTQRGGDPAPGLRPVARRGAAGAVLLADGKVRHRRRALSCCLRRCRVTHPRGSVLVDLKAPSTGCTTIRSAPRFGTWAHHEATSTLNITDSP